MNILFIASWPNNNTSCFTEVKCMSEDSMLGNKYLYEIIMFSNNVTQNSVLGVKGKDRVVLIESLITVSLKKGFEGCAVKYLKELV